MSEAIIQDAEAQVTELNDECERLRARVAELGSERIVLLTERNVFHEALAERDATIARLTRVMNAAQAWRSWFSRPDAGDDALLDFHEATQSELIDAIDAALAEQPAPYSCPDGCDCQGQSDPLIGCRCACHDKQPATANELPTGDA